MAYPMSEITSKPYKPDPAMACDRCCFGRGEHAEWCPLFGVRMCREHFTGLPCWRCATAGMTPEQRQHWLHGSWNAEPPSALKHIPAVVINPHAPPDTLTFISTREPYESEEEWLKRCAVIRNVGAPE